MAEDKAKKATGTGRGGRGRGATKPTTVTTTPDPTQELHQELVTLGLSADQATSVIDTLGLTSSADMTLVEAGDLIALGIKPIPARRVFAYYHPVVPTVLVDSSDDEDLPEPSKEEVTSYAAEIGISPGDLTTFMLAASMGGTGMDMDISGLLPVERIVPGYNPKRRDMAFMIMGQLERRIGSPIVVINDNGSVNHELTIRYINSLEEGFDPAEDNIYYDEDGKPYEIVKVGVDAQSVYDADPVIPSKALQQNGMGSGRVQWNGVRGDVRQVVYYAALPVTSGGTGELNPNDDTQMARLRDKIDPATTRLNLRGDFPAALAKWNEANRTGSLPTLRVQLSRSARRQEVMPRRRAYVREEGQPGMGGGFRDDERTR